MLPETLTFPSDICSSQILYAEFVGTYSRIFALISDFICHE